MQYSTTQTASFNTDDIRQRSKVAFSLMFDKLVKRSDICSSDIRIASLPETLQALEMVRHTMPVAEAALVKAIHSHNPECFRAVWQGSLENSPMMTYLPMNATGAAALVDDRFDPQNPELQFICRPGETPEAIYLWLVFAPGKMVAGLRLVGELEKYGQGCPIFTRPAHSEAGRILDMAGFLPARDYFTGASSDLLFTLSKYDGTGLRTKSQSINVRVVRTFEDMAKIFSVRTATYMCEQLCSYGEEFDGNDFSATHLLGEVHGEPAGCVRIRYFGEFAKIERLAVRPEFRRSRLMRVIAAEALEFCARKGFARVYGHVRCDLVPAWQKMFGATPVEGRPAFSFSDVRYREMEFALPQHDGAIRFGSDPLLTIRPEGDWDRLGPIEKAQFIHTGSRREKIGELRHFGSQKGVLVG